MDTCGHLSKIYEWEKIATNYVTKVVYDTYFISLLDIFSYMNGSVWEWIKVRDGGHLNTNFSVQYPGTQVPDGC